MCSEAANGRKITERAKTVLLFLRRNCPYRVTLADGRKRNSVVAVV